MFNKLISLKKNTIQHAINYIKNTKNLNETQAKILEEAATETLNVLRDKKEIIDRLHVLFIEYSLPVETNKKSLINTILAPSNACLSKIENTTISQDKLMNLLNLLRRENEDIGHYADMSVSRALKEIKWWFLDIGLPADYFARYSIETIATHIAANRSYEAITRRVGVNHPTLIDLADNPNQERIIIASKENHLALEKQLASSPKKGLYISTFFTKSNLVLSVVKPASPLDGITDSSEFFKEPTLDLYKIYLKDQKNNPTNTVHLSNSLDEVEKRITIASNAPSMSVFSEGETILHKYGLTLNRKYLHLLSNSSSATSFYINAEELSSLSEVKLQALLTELQRVGLLPTRFELSNSLSVDETVFTNALGHFVHLFCTTNIPEINALKNKLANDSEALNLLSSLQKLINQNEYKLDLIFEIIKKNPELNKKMYNYFLLIFHPSTSNQANLEELKTSILQDIKKLSNDPTIMELESLIFNFGLLFIQSIERTNFYVPQISAVSFRMNSSFNNILKALGVQKSPFGVFFVVGPDFQGFHFRFQDISRGGLRLKIPKSLEAWHKNLDTAAAEGEGLANAQDKKNIDIAEGGAKGIVEAEPGKSIAEAELSFMRYFDAMIDILLPQNKNFIKNFREEILFFGPDENVGGLMDWACKHAKTKGYKYWKAATTGKSPLLGGISHFDYGMTTTGVLEFFSIMREKLRLQDTPLSIVQTGGPDGDLGSNNLLMLPKNVKVTTIIDGGGVLHDPNGLNREELSRLALLRIDSSNFDTNKLSNLGFMVKTTDNNVLLPSGEIVDNGMQFRNNAHLRNDLMACDFFIPCGGMRESLTATNWDKLLDDKGVPVFKYGIVEGANLFLSDEARKAFQNKGILIFQDFVSNKAGVTSSAYEVLAALALTDEEFQKNMLADQRQKGELKEWRKTQIETIQKDFSENGPAYDVLVRAAGHKGVIPNFRYSYIESIIAKIKANCKEHADVIWRVFEKKNRTSPLTEISKLTNNQINELAATIEAKHAALYQNPELREAVLLSYIPKPLVDLIGVKELTNRIPQDYQFAIFRNEIAKRLVYEKFDGINDLTKMLTTDSLLKFFNK